MANTADTLRKLSSVVWIPLGTFWSLDWDSPDDTLEATVVARDRLELLRKFTYQPGTVQQSLSLYSLAEQVLQDAGLQPGEYWIDPALQQIVSKLFRNLFPTLTISDNTAEVLLL